MASVVDVLRDECYYPIQDTLWQHLGIQDIVNLTRTCKALQPLYRRLVNTQWNLNNRLKRFVEDPMEFRRTLGMCGAIISGSFALQYFARVVWPESDLDIFAQQDHFESLSAFLTMREGYRLTDERLLEDYASVGVRKVLVYRRTGSEAVSEVQVILVETPPAIAVLKGFYMTAVVNFISCNKAFAIFPRQTFVQKRTYLLRDVDDHQSKLVKKYERRGWTTKRGLDSHLDTARDSLKGCRWAGDQKSWTISITPAVEDAEIMPDSVLDCYNFEVYDAGWTTMTETSMRRFNIECRPFSHPALRYEYGCEDYGWEDFMAARLNSVGVQPAETGERGNAIFGFQENQPGEFQRPSGRKYFDKIVPQFLDEYQNNKIQADSIMA
jgi:hypothetical protein